VRGAVPCRTLRALNLVVCENARSRVANGTGSTGRRLARLLAAEVTRLQWAARRTEARTGTTSLMWTLKRVHLHASCRPTVARIHTPLLTAFSYKRASLCHIGAFSKQSVPLLCAARTATLKQFSSIAA